MRSPLNRRLVSFLTKPIGNVLSDWGGKEKDILLDRRDLRAQCIQAPGVYLYTINQNTSCIDIIDAIDQLGQGTFTCPRLTNNRYCLTRLSTEGDVFQHRRAAVAKCDIIKDDLASYLLVISAFIFIQFGLFLQDGYNASRPGYA